MTGTMGSLLPDMDPLDGTELFFGLQHGVTKKGRPISGGAAGGAVLSLQSFATGSYVVGSPGGDDYPALAAAMLAGVSVWLPPAIRLSAQVTMPAGAAIIGQDSTITPTASMASVIKITGGNTLLEGVRFIGSGATAAVQIDKPQNDLPCDVERVSVVGYPKGIWVTGGDVINIVRFWAQNCTTGIASDNGLLNSNIWYPYILNGNCIDVAVPTVQQPEGLRIIGGTLLPYLSGDFGIRLRSGLEIGISGVTIDQLAKTGANGIVIDASGFSVKDVKITDCWLGKNVSATSTGTGIKISGGAAQRVAIRGNTFDGLNGWGIDADGGTGILTAFTITENDIRSCAAGDINLRATRVIIRGNHFTNATTTVAITTTGYGVHSLISDNDFVGAANPVRGNIAGSLVYANKGNTNDSLDWDNQNVGLNDPVNWVVSKQSQFGHTAIAEASGGTSNQQLVVIAATGNGSGANIALKNDGTNGFKYVRAHGPEFQVMDNAYANAILRLDDAGDLVVAGSLTAGGGLTVSGTVALSDLDVAGTGAIAGAWTPTTGTVSASGGSGLTGTGSIRYRKVGRSVFLQARITISALGTGSGLLVCTVPWAAAADSTMAGVESGVSGKALSTQINSGGAALAIRLYDGTYPVTSTSNVFVIEGEYEATT